MQRKWWYGSMAVLAIALSGCDKPPQEEIAKAQAALERANQAGASQYATASYKAVQDSMATLKAEVAAQDQRWFKNYDVARAQAGRVLKMGDDAASESESRKAALKSETEALIAEITPKIAATRASLEAAPRGKDAKEDLDRLGMDLNRVESELELARTQLTQGSLIDALATARSAEGKLTSVNQDVEAAMQKLQARKRPARRIKG